jgi:hypothetical protein
MTQQSQWAKFSLSTIHDRTLLDTQHSVGLLWTSDRLAAETSTWEHRTLKQTQIHAPRGIRTAIPASEQPQTDALDRAATGIVGI